MAPKTVVVVGIGNRDPQQVAVAIDGTDDRHQENQELGVLHAASRPA